MITFAHTAAPPEAPACFLGKITPKVVFAVLRILLSQNTSRGAV